MSKFTRGGGDMPNYDTKAKPHKEATLSLKEGSMAGFEKSFMELYIMAISCICQPVDIGMHRSSVLFARILTILDVGNQTLHHSSEAYRSNIQPFRQSKFKREGGGTFQVNNRCGRNAAGMKVSGRGGAAGVERGEGRNTSNI